MAWEWTGPASGAIVGVAGLLAGWRVAVGSRKHDERLAQQRNEHEARVAHVQWHRDQRADAYIQLLDLAEEIGDWVSSAFPMWDTHPPRPLPDMPDRARQAHV